MGYVVIRAFKDLKDGNYRYEEGATFPRNGATASKARIAELASDKNRRGIALIEKKEDPKPVEQEKVEQEKPKRSRKKNAE